MAGTSLSGDYYKYISLSSHFILSFFFSQPRHLARSISLLFDPHCVFQLTCCLFVLFAS